MPLDTSMLASLGISAKLAAKYVEGGWMVRLARGVYAFPGDELSAHAAIKFLQNQVPGLHVAGRSALALQGVRHNLSTRETTVLWGDARFVLPPWFASRYPARYAWPHLFNWPDDLLAGKTLTTPPGMSAQLRVSVPERAVLEMLYEVGTHQSLEEAHNLFGSLRNLRKDVLTRLLECCTSVKTVRLFLTWARETEIIDVAALQQRPLPVGSNKRWMTRMKDGTLLTLKPHG